jgi:hypothetical protein
MEKDVSLVFIHQIEIIIIASVRNRFLKRLYELPAQGISRGYCPVQAKGNGTTLQVNTPRSGKLLIQCPSSEGGRILELDVETILPLQDLQVLHVGIDRTCRSQKVAHLPCAADKYVDIILFIAGTGQQTDADNEEMKKYFSGNEIHNLIYLSLVTCSSSLAVISLDGSSLRYLP